jgi:hypothetical protein
MKWSSWIFASVWIVALAGCASSEKSASKPPAATQPMTETDPKLATPEYWLSQPAATWVESPSYDVLWNACQEATRDYLFTVDRVDYREGVITTKPLTSAQFFELWKRDVVTWHDAQLSSSATYRRTIHFNITKLPDGSYEAAPKVLVERQAIAERRITSAMYFRNINSRKSAYGTKETDEAIILPAYYWYAVGRDETLERHLSAAVWNKLHPSGLFSKSSGDQ